MKILVYTWNHEYTMPDIKKTLQYLGHSLTFYEYDIMGKDKDNNTILFEKTSVALSRDNYDCLFSVNYFPDIARACHDKNIIYVSWTYDCPLDLKNIEETLIYPTNRAFFFDKVEVRAFNESGISTAYHMPLGINSRRLSKIAIDRKYIADVSFIGRIYHSSFPTLSGYLDEYNKGFLKGIINAQRISYGCYLAQDVLNDKIMADVNTCLKKNNCPYTMDSAVVTDRQLAYSLATEATFENRLLILALISKTLNLNWYTHPDSESIANIQKCAPVDYYTEMPSVFKASTVNLHIGLHSIPSGLSLRQMDILGSNGMLLSSFQPELFDYFTPGEDFDYFTCAEEAYEKACFYANNPAIAREIADTGYAHTKEQFDYRVLLPKILEYVG